MGISAETALVTLLISWIALLIGGLSYIEINDRRRWRRYRQEENARHDRWVQAGRIGPAPPRQDVRNY